MASTEYERDKYLGRIHGKNQFTLVGNTLNAPDINAITITGSTVTGSTALFTTVTGSTITGSTGLFTTLTASQAFVSGGLSVGDYIQLLPVGTVNIPTNQTASYIYTSGSTNDLYFTQYQPGTNFTNTTRLRWLEGGLSTGLLYGGLLSTVNGTTTFNVSSGSGIIVTYNATTTVDPFPTIKYIEWDSFVSQSLVYSGSSQITYVGIDEFGAITQTNTAFTTAQFKDRIVLGRILHQTGSVTNGTVATPTTAYGINSNTQDFFRAFGPLKVSGQVLAASGSTLGLTRTAGDSYVEGRNYSANPNSPNYILAADDPALTTTKIFYEWVSGSTVNIDTNGGVGYTEVRPAFYNLNGTVTAISPTNNKYTVQRVYWFPKSVTRALFIYYGSTIYSTLAEAVGAINNEPNFTEGDNTRSSAVYIGAVVLEANTTDLTSTTKAQIVNAGIFRGSGGGGTGGGGGGTTTPGGVTHAIQFNDSGVFNGSADFTYDTNVLTLNGNFNLVGTGSIDFDGGTITGSLARFTTMSGSVITGSTALYTTITGSTVTGSNALFALITGSVVTGSTALFTTITGSTVTGSTALFTSITASSLTADLATKVSKAGDTMTGNLVITGAKLGINTSNPQYSIHARDPAESWLFGGVGFSPALSTDASTPHIFFGNGGAGFRIQGSASGSSYPTAQMDLSASQDIVFANGSGLVVPTERLKITSTGQLQLLKGGTSTITSANTFVIRDATYPYIHLINNGSGGGAGDGFLVGIENNYANIYVAEAWDLRFATSGTERMRISSTGLVSIGGTAPTARLLLPAGTATANTAPLKFTSGSLLTSPEAGAVEFNGDNLYLTITSSTARKNVTLDDGLTFGQIPFTTGSGRLAGSSALTYTASNSTLNMSFAQNARTAMVVTNNSSLSAAEAGFAATTNVGTFFFGAAPNASSNAGGLIYTGVAAPFRIFTNNAVRILIRGSDGEVGIGVTAPTAVLHLKAGTSTGGTAPLKFTSGPLMSTAEAGAVEFLTDKYYGTITTGASRKEITLNDTALTSGSIPVATTNGRLTNSNVFRSYNTGTTAGTAGTSVSLKVLTFTTSNEFRFLRLAVRGVYPTGGEAFARTINAAWGSGSMGIMQTGADELGTLMFSGTKLDGATIQTSGSGADIYVKCTDVEGAGGTVTWVVAGEYF